MKRALVVAVVCIIILTASTLISIITSEEIGLAITSNDTYDSYFDEQGLDNSEYTPTQKMQIYEYDYQYLTDYINTDYISPSSNPIIFERNWTISSEVDWRNESDFDPDVQLFFDGYHYLTMITFTMPYSVNTAKPEIGYIGVGYSNNFSFSFWYTISVVTEGNEYRLTSESLTLSEDTSMIPIYQNIRSINMLKYPELIYTFFCTATPTIDNDLDEDMYFSVDLDFYIKDTSSEETILIGFNEFSGSTDSNKYTVSRKSVQYDGSEE